MLHKLVLLFNSQNTCKTGMFENANLIKGISSVKMRSAFPEKKQKLITVQSAVTAARPQYTALLTLRSLASHTQPHCVFAFGFSACLDTIDGQSSNVTRPFLVWSTVALRLLKLVLRVPHLATRAASVATRSA